MPSQLRVDRVGERIVCGGYGCWRERREVGGGRGEVDDCSEEGAERFDVEEEEAVGEGDGQVSGSL